MKCAYTREIDKKETSRCAKDFLTYMDLLTGVYLHEELGFGKKRIARYYETTFEDLMAAMEKYGVPTDVERDQMADALTAIIKHRLKYSDINITEWENDVLRERHYTVFKHKGRACVTRARMDFVDHAWLVAVSYFATAMQYLHEDTKLGAGKLEPIYKALRKKYEEFVDLFLMCDRLADAKMQELITEARQKMKDIGIEFALRWAE